MLPFAPTNSYAQTATDCDGRRLRNYTGTYANGSDFEGSSASEFEGIAAIFGDGQLLFNLHSELRDDCRALIQTETEQPSL